MVSSNEVPSYDAFRRNECGTLRALPSELWVQNTLPIPSPAAAMKVTLVAMLR